MRPLNRKTKRGEIEEEEDLEEEELDCPSTCQHALKMECTCRCGGVNHAIKSMRKLDVFFDNKEEEEEEQKVQVVAATVPVPVPVPVAAGKMIRCDDCDRLVPEEEVKVWLAPVLIGEYEGEQDPVHMCRKCTKIFLDDNKEYHFEDLYSVNEAVSKYTPDVLEKWK